MNPFADLAMLKIESPDETFKYAYLGRMENLKRARKCSPSATPWA